MADTGGETLFKVSGPAAKPAGTLGFFEILFPVTCVIALYSSILYGLHTLQATNKVTLAGSGPDNWWATLPSAWDHPEPNYLVSPAIGEFWSVLTTIPVAGTMLTYTGIKYGYGWKVFRIYLLVCIMYTFAFTAHLTLQKHIFSTTVTAVMSNAMLTFAQFSSIVHRFLKSKVLRGAIVLAFEVALISTVAWLPYAIENGGVWTLFAVQSPGVWIATAIAGILRYTAKTPQQVVTYGTVFRAGCLLSTAMALSYVECKYGFEHGIMHNFYGFPHMHIAIHIFEQVGIYYFGAGTAALEELLFEEEPRHGAEVRYVTRFGLPYLYCPYKRGIVPAAPAATKDIIEKKVATPDAAVMSQPAERGRAAEKDQSIQKRKRDATPGAPGAR